MWKGIWITEDMVMFSGIVEEKGTIRKIAKKKNLLIVTLAAGKVIKGTKVGDSICVDGVCLTVAAMKAKMLTFAVMKETIDATTLNTLRPGCKVNLERALKVNSRIGGHLVSGHIDGAGIIRRKTARDNYVEYEISVKAGLRRYIVPKGSIGVDGISLTVGRVGKGLFSVYLIPHTLTATTIGTKKAGDKVNIETDLFAKYILNSRQGPRRG